MTFVNTPIGWISPGHLVGKKFMFPGKRWRPKSDLTVIFHTGIIQINIPPWSILVEKFLFVEERECHYMSMFVMNVDNHLRKWCVLVNWINLPIAQPALVPIPVNKFHYLPAPVHLLHQPHLVVAVVPTTASAEVAKSPACQAEIEIPCNSQIMKL